MPDATPSSLAAELRRHDRDRFQTTLFAPGQCRSALIALYAFNFEVARIREVTREPVLGRIRLQWWRDAVAELYSGAAPRRHEVVAALSVAISNHQLSRAHFDALLDARELDLAEEAPASMEALEAYAEGTSANLVLLALEALGMREGATLQAGVSVGIAYALAGLLASVPFHARMRKVYLPKDVTESHHLDIERSLFELKPSPALEESVKEIAALARYHLSVARAQRSAVPRAARSALLLAVPAVRRLDLLERLHHDVMNPRLARGDALQSWRLAWAALRGVY